MIPSTRAMIKSIKRENGLQFDYKKAGFFDALYSISASFKKSDGFQKATILAGPDYESAIRIYNRENIQNGEDAGIKSLRQFIAGLNKKYKDRITNDSTERLIKETPWAAKYMSEERSHPNAVAIPQDFWGYILQPGDPINNWGKPLFDTSKLDDLYWDYMPRSSTADFGGSVKGLGLRVGQWDEDLGEHDGFVYRPSDGNQRDYFGIGRYASRYPQNISNANIAFEAGKKSGINGPQGEKRALTMLTKQMLDAYHSSNSDTRNAAEMYLRYLKYLRPTWYNPRSYHVSGTNEVALRSPEQVMAPMHGMPGSSFWEETGHGIDNTIGAAMGRGDWAHLSSIGVNPVIFGGLYDDFTNRFGGDPEKITEHAEKIINGWDKPNGGRYADAHEYIELLNHMYNVGTGGKDAPGLLGYYANHGVRGREWDPKKGASDTLTEAFNSLTNGRMTGNEKGIKMIDQNLPNASKASKEMYKQANDFHEDNAKKVEFNLGSY